LQKKLPRCSLRSKDAKKLVQEVSEKYGINVEQFLENKIRVESCQIDIFTVFLLNGKPLLAKSDDTVFFTLFFEQVFSLFPKVIVDMGAVPYICKGADVMAPGIRKIQGEFNQNGLLLIVDERYGKPLAVGLALLDSEEMKNTPRGKVIKTLHYVGDKLWNNLKSS
jgi:PUA-domain protein